MEPRFGFDFSQVRIHTDERAAETARGVNALAYTVGRNVVFEVGQYKPGTSEGRRLLAHELTHVIQQNNPDGLHQQQPISLQRKVNLEFYEQIRNKLSRQEVSEKEVYDVLQMLGKLNDGDLKDTITLLGNELIDRMFSKISAEDKRNKAALLDRIIQLREKTLLLTYKQSKFCKEPTEGPWEITAEIINLSELVKTVERMAANVPLKKLGIFGNRATGEGQLALLEETIDAKNVDQYSAELSKLDRYLTSDADLYLLNCQAGAWKKGTTFLTKLSKLLPGRRIIGFTTETILPIPHETFSKTVSSSRKCLEPSEIKITDIQDMPQGLTVEQQLKIIKQRAPVADNLPQTKIAKNGEIIRWPVIEQPEPDWLKKKATSSKKKERSSLKEEKIGVKVYS